VQIDLYRDSDLLHKLVDLVLAYEPFVSSAKWPNQCHEYLARRYKKGSHQAYQTNGEYEEVWSHRYDPEP